MNRRGVGIWWYIIGGILAVVALIGMLAASGIQFGDLTKKLTGFRGVIPEELPEIDLQEQLSLEKKKLEESKKVRTEETKKFNEIKDIKSDLDKVKAYEDFIQEDPDGRYVPDAYFEIGKLYHYRLLSSEKAELAYNKALDAGYYDKEIILNQIRKLKQDAQKSKAEIAKQEEDFETSLNNLKESIKQNQYSDALKAISDLSVLVEDQKAVIHPDKVIDFRLSQIEALNKFATIDHARAAYDVLVKETDDWDVWDKAKETLGENYVNTYELPFAQPIQQKLYT